MGDAGERIGNWVKPGGFFHRMELCRPYGTRSISFLPTQHSRAGLNWFRSPELGSCGCILTLVKLKKRTERSASNFSVAQWAGRLRQVFSFISAIESGTCTKTSIVGGLTRFRQEQGCGKVRSLASLARHFCFIFVTKTDRMFSTITPQIPSWM